MEKPISEGLKFEKPSREKEPAEELKKFLENYAKGLKEEGIPIKEDCRIDMAAFKEIFGQKEIENDQKLIEEYQRKFEEERKELMALKRPERIFEEKEKTGENLEILKTAIFAKFLGAEFALMRTSPYDDIKNGVDNVIFEKKTGNLVCALDEVGEMSGKRFEEKKERILRRNIREGGGKLKYGLKLERDKLILGRIFNIPIFYLALPKRYIAEGMKNFIPSFEDKSDYEKKLFKAFFSLISYQINSLKLESDLNPTLKNYLSQFEKTLQRIEI